MAIREMNEAAEAVTQFVPETVVLSDGNAVSVGRLHFLCWRAIYEELGQAFAAMFGAGSSPDKLLDFPMAMLKLAAYSTLPGRRFDPDACAEHMDRVAEWDHRDIIRVARTAFRVNYTTADVEELRDFLGELGGAITKLLPKAQADHFQSPTTGTPLNAEELFRKAEPPNRRTRRQQNKSATASGSED